ncbi:hypothetical protein [Xanthomonas hortorum]|uniref:Uncharacterized protein n=1 Tax=Xanthomonas hortorum TaxID=56454 RepID=A0AA47ENN2_9XANT|nr:hypothetical protein [Xanthomonas hortorum]WAH62379.1 hypothetical protein OEG85_12575 [Xanthomonas hortorum]
MKPPLNSVVLQLAQEVTRLQSIMGSDHDLKTMINYVVTQQIENSRGMHQVVVLSRVIQQQCFPRRPLMTHSH